jgi:hypothetical protein
MSSHEPKPKPPINPEILAPEATPGSALEALNRSEIEQQITTARRYPRSITAFRNRGIQMATIDAETAASCEYRLSRSDKPIVGPSVRMAEIVAAAYGNLRAGARIIDVGEREVTAQGMAHDLENNTAYQVEVRRRITKSNGQRFSDDMILVTCNAACAIALRNAVFKVVPMALAKPIMEAAQRTAVGDEKTFKSRCVEAFKQFAELGVTEEQILARLELKGSADLTIEHLRALHGMLTALRDNEASVEEEFAPVARAGVPPRVSREPKPEQKAAGAGPGLDEVLRTIQAAKTGDDCDAAVTLTNGLPPKDRDACRTLIEERRNQVEGVRS